MMQVQISVTKGEVGLETIATIGVLNVTQGPARQDEYKYQIRHTPLIGEKEVHLGEIMHLRDDGALRLIQRILNNALGKE